MLHKILTSPPPYSARGQWQMMQLSMVNTLVEPGCQFCTMKVAQHKGRRKEGDEVGDGEVVEHDWWRQKQGLIKRLWGLYFGFAIESHWAPKFKFGFNFLKKELSPLMQVELLQILESVFDRCVNEDIKPIEVNGL